MDKKKLEATCQELAVLLNQKNKCFCKEIAEIIKHHSTLAIGGTIVPFGDPLVNPKNISSMFSSINEKCGLTLGENLTKKFAQRVWEHFSTTESVTKKGLFDVMRGYAPILGPALIGKKSYAATYTAGVVYVIALTQALKNKEFSSLISIQLQIAINEALKNTPV